LAELVGELSVRSADFARLWAGHAVKPCSVMTLDLRHPAVGPITVTQQTMTSATDADQFLYLSTTAPGSASEQALKLLGGR
jgi:hypothetical protein